MNELSGPRTWGAAPSLDDFAVLADEAFARLPEEFQTAVGHVDFRVMDFADDATLRSVGLEDPFDLSGLYHGAPITVRSVMDPFPKASLIFLYRRPILDEWAERGDVTLEHLIEHVLIHEIGHHFGMSDDDIHAIEDRAE